MVQTHTNAHNNVHVYTHIWMLYICRCTHPHTHMNTSHAHTFSLSDTYCTCTHTFSPTHAYTHCHMHTPSHAHTHSLRHTYERTCTHTHKHTHAADTGTNAPSQEVTAVTLLAHVNHNQLAPCTQHNTALQYMITGPTARINWSRDIYIPPYNICINPHGEHHNHQPSLVKPTQQLQPVCTVIALFLGHPALHTLINDGRPASESSTRVLLLQSSCPS